MVIQVQRSINQPIEPTVHQPVEDLVDLPKQYSPEEYLQMEVQSDIHHEFRDGEIIPMVGGMPNHNKIAGNIYAMMNFAFRGKPYQAFITDQRLWVSEWKIYTYPDVMVIEGELQLQEGRRDTVTNPLLIVEVLSRSTRDYDRGDKFVAYRTISSFQEYVLVDQYSQHIEHYVKAGPKKWEFQEYDETDTVVKLSTINLDIAIVDFYDKVNFESEEELEPSVEAKTTSAV